MAMIAISNSQKRERSQITIDGMPTVEIDVRASHLTIAHRLLCSSEVLSDTPYFVPGYPRDMVKTCIVMAFGKGRAPTRWTSKQKDELAAHFGGNRSAVPPVSVVWTATVEQLPFLKFLEESEIDWGILQYLESEAFLYAMKRLWSDDIPSLPVHDSLIVPSHACEEAETAICAGYREIIDIQPTLVVHGKYG